MRICWQRVRDDICAELVASGYDNLQSPHRGLPLSDTGRNAARTACRAPDYKQSVNDLLRDLEDIGYLTREAESSDKRARIVRLTRLVGSPSGRAPEGAENGRGADRQDH